MTFEMTEIIKEIIFVLALIPFFMEFTILLLSFKYKSIASNISKSTNETFRAIKLRYTNSAKLGIPVKNADSFVTKSLLGKEGPLGKILGADRFSCLMVCFNLFWAIIFAMKNHSRFTYIIAVMSLCFYIFRQACAVEHRVKLITALTEDYLENTLWHRLNPSQSRGQIHVDKPLPKKNVDIAETPVAASSLSTENRTAAAPLQPLKKTPSQSLSDDNNDIIEAVLQEFLT